MVDVLANDAIVEAVVTDIADRIYSYDFLCDNALHMYVSVISGTTETVLSYGGGDFTVQDLGVENGGTITLAAGITTVVDDTIRMKRLSIIKRDTQFVSSGDLTATALNTELNNFAKQQQELRRDIDFNLAPSGGDATAWDALSKRIANVADAVAGNDAVNKTQMLSEIASASIGGNVIKTGAVTDNSLQRANGTTGGVIQGSNAILDDSDNLSGISSFSQVEKAAAEADVAGYGQWWTKNDTPNKPMFTDDAGTDTQLADAAIVAVHVAKFLKIVSFGDYSAIDFTGATPNAVETQEAIDDAADLGYTILRPAGIVQLEAPITWPEASHMKGPGKPAGSYSNKYAFWHINHTGIGFKNDDNVGSRSMEGIGFYRTQPTPGASYTPTAHDFDVEIEGGQDTSLINCHFHNSTKAINVVGKVTGAINCGRLLLQNITGQPLTEGIRMTHCTDVDRLDNIHFWVYWSSHSGVVTYTRASGSGFIFGRSDNAQFGRLFSWGYQRGLIINNQAASGSLPTGTVGKMHILSFDADNCSVGVLMNSGSDGADLTIGKLSSASDPSNPSISTEDLIWFLGDNARLKVFDIDVRHTNKSAVTMAGTGNKMSVWNIKSTNIDDDAGGDFEFNVGAGNRLLITNLPETSAASKYGGAGIIETPDWRDFTSTITAQTGTLTTVSEVSKFRRIADTVDFAIHITITTNGTGAGDIRATLPFTNGSESHQVFGREIASTGKSLAGTIAASSASAIITNYDNTYPGGDGTQVVIQGTYEV